MNLAEVESVLLSFGFQSVCKRGNRIYSEYFFTNDRYVAVVSESHRYGLTGSCKMIEFCGIVENASQEAWNQARFTGAIPMDGKPVQKFASSFHPQAHSKTDLVFAIGVLNSFNFQPINETVKFWSPIYQDFLSITEFVEPAIVGKPEVIEVCDE